MITRVRGTEDFLDLTLQNFVLDQIKKHLHLYNFSEVETPILEPTSLFIRAVGEQTDIVSKEMYVLDQDKEESICLRPEATASIVRAYVENGVQQAPWKVFLHGPMFRRERPQKGRWRQFSQLTIEAINQSNVHYDAHFLKMLDVLFSQTFKLENYVLKLNFLGCINDRKKHKDALLKFLNKKQDALCPTCRDRKDKNTLRVFDCKNEACKQEYIHAPKIIDYLCKDCSGEWKSLENLLQMLSLSYVIDNFLVRGLDYYNKTVFEFSSRDLGAQNAFCGGGRYALGKEVGGKDDFPSVGVGIGMGRLIMLVEKTQNRLALPEPRPLHVIIPMTKEQQPLALLLAQELLQNNLCTEIFLQEASMTNMMKKANKIGARYVLVLGEDELKNGTIMIKNMLNGESTSVQQNKFLSAIIHS